MNNCINYIQLSIIFSVGKMYFAIYLNCIMVINFDEIYVIFRSRKVVSTGVMQHSATVCSDALEMFVAESRAATSAAVDCSQTLSQGCVEPVVINTRPVILVSGRHMVHKAAAAAVGSVVVIQHALPLSVECSAKLSSAGSSQNDSQSASRSRHKRKRRRKNKASYDTFKNFFLSR